MKKQRQSKRSGRKHKGFTPSEVKKTIAKAGKWFYRVIIEKHKQNIAKAASFDQYKVNPMLLPYLAQCISGQVTAKSVAKALIYPRVLGTSITTSFGSNLQHFITEVIPSSLGSITEGLDLEFIDTVDGRKKYAQIKLGPNTINKDDVLVIHGHFKKIRGLARANKLKNVEQNDYVIGVMYGTVDELSSHYQRLRDTHHYNVLVGEEFWLHLTGDSKFFAKLIAEFTKQASKSEPKKEIEKAVNRLAKTPDIIKIVKQLKKIG